MGMVCRVGPNFKNSEVATQRKTPAVVVPQEDIYKIRGRWGQNSKIPDQSIEILASPY